MPAVQKQTKGTKQGSDGSIISGSRRADTNGEPDFERRCEAKPLFHRFVYLVSFCSKLKLIRLRAQNVPSAFHVQFALVPPALRGRRHRSAMSLPLWMLASCEVNVGPLFGT